ncbi:AMP-binding protein [Christensenellaceae bacterium OttesenSCG-928-K19]|nr:AMP-binding protein [Christensenellaceae bacterium OttesenSCG-928-K19]
MKPYPYNQTRDVKRIKDIVTYRIANTPHKDAFRVRLDAENYQGISWEQFKNDIDSFGSALTEKGLQGAHIGVVGENSYEWILTFFTALCGAGVIVPLDRELGPERMKELVEFADVQVLVFAKSQEKNIDAIKDDLQGVKEFICMSDDTKYTPLSTILADGKKIVSGGNTTFADVQPDPEALSAIYFTSGTSGLSKGVMLSQKNMIASFDGATQHILFTEDDIFLSVLPMHHAYESNCGILAILHHGSTICFNENLKLFLANMQLFKPTAMALVPLIADTLFRQIMDSARKSGKIKKLQTGMKISDFLLKLNIDLTEKLFGEVHTALGGRLKKCFVGGAPMNPIVTRAFRQLGITMLQGYGITECSPLVAVNRENFYKDDSVGPVLPTCRVKITDGEVLVKGDNVMMGYYKDEQATKDTFADGWYMTGDLGYLDMDGFLYITGRKKNLIILDSGENVSPEELEGYLVNLPLVSEVAVFQSGNQITAEVYPNTDYASENDIADIEAALKEQITDINRGLPRYKHILSVRLRDTEFEKNTSKKIIRYKLNGGD